MRTQNQRKRFFKPVHVVIFIIAIVLITFFVSIKIKQQKEIEQEMAIKERLKAGWKGIICADKLVSAEEFIKGDYKAGFWWSIERTHKDEQLYQKMASLGSKGNVFKKINTLPAREKRFVYGGYLGWHQQFMEKHFSFDNAKVSGGSNKYSYCIAGNTRNDGYVAKRDSGKLPPFLYTTSALEAVRQEGFIFGYDFLAGLYDTTRNLLVLDNRFLLPPALWLCILHHEERHAYDDIISHKNRPPIFDKKKMVDFETIGRLMMLFSWKIFRDEFLESWHEKGLDSRPEYLTAKLILVDILLTEPLFDKYLLGDPAPLKEYVQKALE